MSVKCFKLVSGEDVIAIVNSESDDSYQIKSPMRLTVVPHGGEANLMLMPFVFSMSKESTVKISKNHIICIYEPEVSLSNTYNEQFGNGIIIANNTPNVYT